MVTREQTTIYRSCILILLQELRSLVYSKQTKPNFPTDAYLASLLGLSATAFSSISRCCASMSGVVLFRLLSEISKLSEPKDFVSLLNDFLTPLISN